MSRIILVRHASHDRVDRILCGRMAGVSLGDEGRREADALGQALRNCGARAVLTSPRARSVETAHPIARVLGLPVIEESGLDEIDFGDWTGRSFADLSDDPLWWAWNTQRDRTRPPGGEGMGQAQARAVAALAGRPEECLIAVSHGDVIRAVLLHVLGLSIAVYDRLVVDPASIACVDIWPGGGRVRGVNATAHLS